MPLKFLNVLINLVVFSLVVFSQEEAPGKMYQSEDIYKKYNKEDSTLLLNKQFDEKFGPVFIFVLKAYPELHSKRITINNYC